MTDGIYLIAKTWNLSKNIRKRIDKRRGCKMPKNIANDTYLSRM